MSEAVAILADFGDTRIAGKNAHDHMETRLIMWNCVRPSGTARDRIEGYLNMELRGR